MPFRMLLKWNLYDKLNHAQLIYNEKHGNMLFAENNYVYMYTRNVKAFT